LPNCGLIRKYAYQDMSCVKSKYSYKRLAVIGSRSTSTIVCREDPALRDAGRLGSESRLSSLLGGFETARFPGTGLVGGGAIDGVFALVVLPFAAGTLEAGACSSVLGSVLDLVERVAVDLDWLAMLRCNI
jgi:hypothetical protein